MLTNLVIVGIALLLVIIYVVWPFRKDKDRMRR